MAKLISIFRVILFALFIINSKNCFASESHYLAVLYSENNSKYISQLQETIIHKNKTNFSVKYINLTNKSCSIDLNQETENADLIFAVGVKGLKRALMCTSEAHILAAYISKYNYEKILQEHYSKCTEDNRKVSVVYIEQPLKRYFYLVKAVYSSTDKKIKVGVLLGPESTRYKSEISKIAKNNNIDLIIKRVNEKNNTAINFQEVINKSDMLLAIPDPTIFNKKSMHGILLMGSKYGIPIIGYSKALVYAGAMSAVYSKIMQHTTEAVDLAIKIINNPYIDAVRQYPNQYSIKINRHIAKNLDFEISTAEDIKFKIDKGK